MVNAEFAYMVGLKNALGCEDNILNQDFLSESGFTGF